MLDLKKELLKRNIESDGYYIDDLEKLLKSQGVCLVNNRWVVFNIF